MPQCLEATAGAPASLDIPDRGVVAIRYSGRPIGLYRVKEIGAQAVLLNHGGISFPVGTQVDIEDIHSVMNKTSSSSLHATVVCNTADGLRLVWCCDRSGEVVCRS